MDRYDRPAEEAELSCIFFEVVMSFNAQLQRPKPTNSLVCIGFKSLFRMCLLMDNLMAFKAF